MSSSRGKGSKHGLAESQSNNIIITFQQGLNYILLKATEAMASDARYFFLILDSNFFTAPLKNHHLAFQHFWCPFGSFLFVL